MEPTEIHRVAVIQGVRVSAGRVKPRHGVKEMLSVKQRLEFCFLQGKGRTLVDVLSFQCTYWFVLNLILDSWVNFLDLASSKLCLIYGGSTEVSTELQALDIHKTRGSSRPFELLYI